MFSSFSITDFKHVFITINLKSNQGENDFTHQRVKRMTMELWEESLTIDAQEMRQGERQRIEGNETKREREN